MKKPRQTIVNLITLALSAYLAPGLTQAAQAARKAEPPPNYYQKPTSLSGKVVVIPSGFVFEGRISKTIGSAASRPGDRFTIEVFSPVMANGTEVLIPSGAEISGEVVEAISSSRQPKERGMPRPLGKLRTQLMTITLPDGASFPVVASLAPDSANDPRGAGGLKSRQSSVAYVGSEAGFNAVNPALQGRGTRDRNGRLAVIKKDDFLRDEILGNSQQRNQTFNGPVRALVKKGRDLYIYSGSSLSIRLDAPLKMTYAASQGRASMEADHITQTSGDQNAGQSNAPEGDANKNNTASGGKRFSKSKKEKAPEGPDPNAGGNPAGSGAGAGSGASSDF